MRGTVSNDADPTAAEYRRECERYRRQVRRGYGRDPFSGPAGAAVLGFIALLIVLAVALAAAIWRWAT